MEDRSSLESTIYLVDQISKKKLKIKYSKLFVLGIMAGAYIAIAGAFATLVSHDSLDYFGYGVSKLLAGLVFSLGLILVMVAGAELFTGNTMIVTGVFRKHGSIRELVNRWVIVFFANFVGSILIVILYFYSNLWQSNNGEIAQYILAISDTKVNLTFVEAFTRGILANWLVCLAVFLSLTSKNVVGKISAMILPVSAFVALGFEHSIANMYLIPIGIFINSSDFIINSGLMINNLNWQTFWVNNLFPVVIGNIIGGAIMVGMTYWFANIYHEDTNEESKR